MTKANETTNVRVNGGGTEKASCCGDECCAGVGKEKDDAREGVSAAAGMSGSSADAVRDRVREGYSRIARSGSWNAAQESGSSAVCCGGASAVGGGGCCGPATLSAERVAEVVGYGEAELGGVPSGANMGLSCGNPTALASLREGEVVLDLGSGGGFDCFVAGPRVGERGRVIGVDMTAEMVSKARGGLGWYREKTGLENVEFRLGEIEHLPLADGSVDVVISNCVLNLSPDKGRVWKELARVLKPGGRVAVSDLALLRELPAGVRGDVEALVGCVAGAELVEEMIARAEAAGLVDVEARAKSGYVEAMMDGEDPLYRAIAARLPGGRGVGDYVTSVDVTARKRE